MQRIRRLVVSLAAVALLIPTTALAKGASEASIVGPGLQAPIALEGSEDAGTQLGAITIEAGFFPAVFRQSPDPMLDSQPSGVLGPRYVVTYVMPGPDGAEDTIVQDVFSYATPLPVTYVEPGQEFWSTERTRGGWYVASHTLRDLLVAAGLPAVPPSAAPERRNPGWKTLAPFAVAGVAVSLALGVWIARRSRRDQTRTVTASRSAS